MVAQQGRPPRRPDHRRGEDRPARRALVLLHRRGHAARPRRRVPRGGRDPALRRSRPRPRLHRPPAARPRPGRDHVPGRRDDPPAAAAPGAAGPASRPGRACRSLATPAPPSWSRLPPRTAVVAFSAAEVYAIAELIRRRRGGCAVVMGRLSPAHPQRPGGALPGQGGRFPGRHRRDRHGPEHGRRPRRLRRPGQVRRPPAAPADAPPRWRRSPAAPAAACATARSAPPPTVRRCADEVVAAVEAHSFRAARPALLAQQRPRLQPRGRAAGQPDGAAAAARAGQGQRRRRPGDAGRAGARARDPPPGARPAAGAPAVGGLPDPGFPQAGRRHATPGSAPACSATSRATSGCRPTGWPAQIGALAPRRRRHRHADAAARRRAGLVLHRRPRRLGAGRAALAGPRARGRGPAVGRAARAADQPLRRSPRRAPDAPAGGGRGRGTAVGRHPARRGGGRGPPGRPRRRLRLLARPAARGRREAARAARRPAGAARGDAAPRRAGWRRRPTPPSPSADDQLDRSGTACRLAV